MKKNEINNNTHYSEALLKKHIIQLAETIDENTSIQESRNRITDILKEYGKGKKSVLEKMIENIESFLPLEKGMFIKFILKNYLNTFYNI